METENNTENRTADNTNGDASAADALKETAEQLKTAGVSDQFVEFAESAIDTVTALEADYTKVAKERDSLTQKLADTEKQLETAKKASENGDGSAATTTLTPPSDATIDSITESVKRAYNLDDAATKKFSEDLRCSPEYMAQYLDKLLKSATAQPAGRGIDSDKQASSEFFTQDTATRDDLPDTAATREKLAAVLREGAN